MWTCFTPGKLIPFAIAYLDHYRFLSLYPFGEKVMLLWIGSSRVEDKGSRNRPLNLIYGFTQGFAIVTRHDMRKTLKKHSTIVLSQNSKLFLWMSWAHIS